MPCKSDFASLNIIIIVHVTSVNSIFLWIVLRASCFSITMEKQNRVIILIAGRPLFSYGRGPPTAAITPCPKSTGICPLNFPCRLIQGYKTSRISLATHNALKIRPCSIFSVNMESRPFFCICIYGFFYGQRIRHVGLILLPGGHCGEELPCHAVHADKPPLHLSCHAVHAHVLPFYFSGYRFRFSPRLRPDFGRDGDIRDGAFVVIIALRTIFCIRQDDTLTGFQRPGITLRCRGPGNRRFYSRPRQQSA